MLHDSENTFPQLTQPDRCSQIEPLNVPHDTGEESPSTLHCLVKAGSRLHCSTKAVQQLSAIGGQAPCPHSGLLQPHSSWDEDQGAKKVKEPLRLFESLHSLHTSTAAHGSSS